MLSKISSVVFGDVKHQIWVPKRRELSLACRFTQRCLMPQTHVSRRGHSGAAFPPAAVHKALKLRAQGVKRGGQTHMSWRAISAAVGAFSSATAMRWAQKDMSPEGCAIRKKNSGHNRTRRTASPRAGSFHVVFVAFRPRRSTHGSSLRVLLISAFLPHGSPDLLLAITSLCVGAVDANFQRCQPPGSRRQLSSLVNSILLVNLRIRFWHLIKPPSTTTLREWVNGVQKEGKKFSPGH